MSDAQTPDLEETVRAAVLALARRRNPAIAEVQPAHRLTGELGLKSLDLAELVAGLEMELAIDPFAELVAITSVRTVADLCDAYRRGLAGEAPAPSAAVAAGAGRAEARRQAALRRPARPRPAAPPAAPPAGAAAELGGGPRS